MTDKQEAIERMNTVVSLSERIIAIAKAAQDAVAQAVDEPPAASPERTYE